MIFCKNLLVDLMPFERVFVFRVNQFVIFHLILWVLTEKGSQDQIVYHRFQSKS